MCTRNRQVDKRQTGRQTDKQTDSVCARARTMEYKPARQRASKPASQQVKQYSDETGTHIEATRAVGRAMAGVEVATWCWVVDNAISDWDITTQSDC